MIFDVGSNLKYILLGGLIAYLIDRWWHYRSGGRRNIL